jgi:lysozyme
MAQISQKGIDLIKKFEGIELKAYIDPVGIPTIGYGTIRYPNGTKVRMGDTISLAEAEAFLLFECEGIDARLSEILGSVAVNQNQRDALISFCFNLGIGAFLESTMLKRLRAGDFAAAAAEFPRWNKGMVDGVKVELPGLTRRRAAERALFESAAAGARPLPESVSNQEKVFEARGYRDGGANVIAGFSKEGDVLDIIELEDELPDTLIAALGNYPNMASFGFARQREPIPAGPRTLFSGLARPMPKVKRAPRLIRQLLVLGMEDDENSPGNEIRHMQSRLTELGYYVGPLNGVFDLPTDSAAREFQADFFGRAEADGRVGPKTWKKLWGEGAVAPVDIGQPSTKNYLKLTRTDDKDRFGCVVLILANYRRGELAGSIEVCSGQPRKQIFRTGVDSPSGSMEPLPEGKWRVEDIEWAAGKDNYSGAIWSNGLGPAKIRTPYVGPRTTRRAAIEIHIDWNRPSAPGTAGCIGLQNISDFKTLVGWLRETDPRDLFVDWGLGTCPEP